MIRQYHIPPQEVNTNLVHILTSTCDSIQAELRVTYTLSSKFELNIFNYAKKNKIAFVVQNHNLLPLDYHYYHHTINNICLN